MRRSIALLMMLFLLLPSLGYGQEGAAERSVDELKLKVEKLEREVLRLNDHVARETSSLKQKTTEMESDSTLSAGLLLVCGVLCALWAQYTERSAWMWFFFGLFLSPLAFVMMLWKNSAELKAGLLKPWTSGKGMFGELIDGRRKF